jgi:hypothetical protein
MEKNKSREQEFLEAFKELLVKYDAHISTCDIETGIGMFQGLSIEMGDKVVLETEHLYLYPDDFPTSE